MALKLPQATNHSNSYHGRRLMQLLFRANASNNDEHMNYEPIAASQGHMRDSSGANDKQDALDPRAEEDCDRQQQFDGCTISRLNGVGSHRASLPLPTTAQSSSKFHSLKRKLFPSRMRTALPARIPPLVTSPISVSSSAIQAKTESDVGLQPDSSNQHVPAAPEPQLAYTQHRKSHRERANSLTTAISNEDNDSDLELEIAIENLDSDTGTEQDTLDEMNRAIENLLKWKQHREQETQAAIRNIASAIVASTGQAAKSHADQRELSSAVDDDSQALEQEYKRKKERWELEREAQMTNLKLMEERFQEMIPRTVLDEDDVARVEHVLLESNRLESDESATATLSSGGISDGSSNTQTCRLRDEIFDLGVRELSSSIQASLLLELEGAGSELDMKLYDVEAFAADLDFVLAQFSDQQAVARTSSSGGSSTQEGED